MNSPNGFQLDKVQEKALYLSLYKERTSKLLLSYSCLGFFWYWQISYLVKGIFSFTLTRQNIFPCKPISHNSCNSFSVCCGCRYPHNFKGNKYEVSHIHGCHRNLWLLNNENASQVNSWKMPQQSFRMFFNSKSVTLNPIFNVQYKTCKLKLLMQSRSGEVGLVSFQLSSK